MEPAVMQAPFAICLLRLQVGILTGGIEAGAVSIMAEVAMTYDDGAGVALVQLLQKL